MAPIEELQARWKTLYGETLPRLARAKDNVQPHWPVHVDHCFGRIILDNAVGVTQPWAAVIKAPAWKNMTVTQIENAIELGESIATGQVNLDELNRRSLHLREKKGPTAAKGKGAKRKADGLEFQQKDGAAGSKSDKSTQRLKQRKTDTLSSYFDHSPKSEEEKKPSRSALLSPPDKHNGIRTIKHEASESSYAPYKDTASRGDGEQTRTNPITNAKYDGTKDPCPLIHI